jgi:hypothetical protein
MFRAACDESSRYEKLIHCQRLGERVIAHDNMILILIVIGYSERVSELG